MPVSINDYSSHDLQIWEEELDSFVPQRVFDAHMHLFHPDHLSISGSTTNRWGLTDFETARQWATVLYPGREVHFLFLGTPLKGINVKTHNRWCYEQYCQDPQSRMNRLVTPSCDVEEIRRDVVEGRFIGLKPYRVFSVTGDIAACRIHDFLPHRQMELANELGLWVTMHLARFHGCADSQNLSDLEDYTLHRYPNIKWILAHCARSFTYWPIRQAIDRLRDLPNIWYDVSAVTDVRPLITLFSREDRRRIFYGSDGADATYFHGQYVALGRAWQGLDANQLGLLFPHCDGRPILAIYEQLLSMKHAAEIAQWSSDDIEDLFWRNASEAFDIRFHGFESSPSTLDALQTQSTYDRAKQIIPGGTQLLSKRPEMFAPGLWPAYARQARGCEVIDLDGRRFIDMTTSGIGSCLLGYADPDVTEAVIQRIALGAMSSLNSEAEVELAELLIELHPWADQARFARTGGEAMSIAVRLARAATGRDKILFCGYHGWSDWYLAANLDPEHHWPRSQQDGLKGHLLPGLDPAGVPYGLGGTALPFTYNRLDELKVLADRYGCQVAAVVMEPTRNREPEPGFLEGVRQVCDRLGAVLVFDEISSGWRMHLGGVHLKYGIEPDIAVYAKAISNGHPMAAIIGRRDFMDAAQGSFVSSTYWTEAVGPTAALATIRKLQKIDIATHTGRIGDQMRQAWLDLGRRHGVPAIANGHSALLSLGFEHQDALALGTLLTARMLEKGFLAGGGFYPSFAHQEHHIAAYTDAAETVFAELAQAICKGDVYHRLDAVGTEVRHGGFKRLT